MTKKQSTPKHQKTATSTRRPSIKARARAIIGDAEMYDAETRHSIRNALTNDDSDLAEMVRRAEEGEEILDLSAVSEKYARAAAAVAAFANNGDVPDWLTNLVTRGLEYATERTGVQHYKVTDFDTRGLSYLLGITDSIEYEELLAFEPVRGLSDLISAVLKHPELPAELHESMGEAVASLGVDDESPEYIRLALDHHRKEQSIETRKTDGRVNK